MRIPGVLLVATLVACGPSSGGDDGMEPVTAIELEPAFASVTVPVAATATQAYQVFGTTTKGRVDVTSTCTLAIDPLFGTFAGATATVGGRGGKASVTATCGELTADGALTINLGGNIIVPPAPANAADLFDNAVATTDAERTPVIEYPLDGAIAPRNMPAVEVQYTAAGNNLFHVRLASTFVAVDIYTPSVEALLEDKAWEQVIETTAGDKLLITVEGLLASEPGKKYASTITNVVVARDSIDKTAIYYWASSRGNIMEATFGATTAPNLVKDGCTSCHSVNRAGTRIGYSRCVANDCGNLFAGFLKYNPATKAWDETVNANDMAIRGSFTTFAPVGNPYPNDSKSLAMVGLNTGTLALYDPDTGTPVASNLEVATHGPGAPRSALMPDWSPDGSKVAFTSAPAAGAWIDLAEGRIAVMSYAYANDTHTFGEPQFIVPGPITLLNGTYTNFFFPSFSPDGKLIVFNAARDYWRNGDNARNPGQRLMLADATGAWVHDMPAMNGGYVDADITWAHWAPTVGTDYYWIVFSSQRDYGHRVTAGNTDPSCVFNGVTQCKQIWIGAVARNRLTGQVDPSAPPMWMPGQDPKASNISPYWSLPAGIQ